VKLLVAGEVPLYKRTSEWLEVPVRRVLAHEVVAVDL
jgi:hypothetical protein